MTNLDSLASLRPDEATLRQHLKGARFQSGCARNRWRLAAPVEWPCVFVAVSAPPRLRAPNEWVFRFDCTDYPQQAPTGVPWDLATNARLQSHLWPHGTGRFAAAFNLGWNNGQAMYLPCDRLALIGHDVWREQHPDLLWTPARDLTFFLEILHGYFDSSDYQGTRAA